MRILYIINGFTWGGAERLTYELALRAARQAQWIGIVGLYRYDNEHEAQMVHTLNCSGIDTLILNKKAGKDRWQVLQKIRQFAKEHDATVIHGHCTAPMLFAKLVGLQLRRPVVCTIHSIAGYSALQEKLTAWMTSRYVSIGADAERYMTDQLGIPEKKITRIYNAVDVQAIEAGRKDDAFWMSRGARPGDQIVLTVARVTEAKNQLCQIRAIETCLQRGHSRVQLFILGSYTQSDPLYQSFVQYIAEHGLEEHVHFLGMDSCVADYLANADCFVMTSFYEGLSVAFLEAVLAGCPIITTDVPFVHELNAMSPCSEVIPQDDSDVLADKLIRRDYRPQQSGTMKLFRERFSMERFAKQHIELYKAL